MTIGERIREVRLSRPDKPSLEKFAERLGITKGSMSLIENGKNQPSDQTVRSICREYGIREEWIRTGTGQRETKEAEITDAVKKLFAAQPDGFKIALISALLKIDAADKWDLLEEIYNSVAKDLGEQDNEKKP